MDKEKKFIEIELLQNIINLKNKTKFNIFEATLVIVTDNKKYSIESFDKNKVQEFKNDLLNLFDKHFDFSNFEIEIKVCI